MGALVEWQAWRRGRLPEPGASGLKLQIYPQLSKATWQRRAFFCSAGCSAQQLRTSSRTLFENIPMAGDCPTKGPTGFLAAAPQYAHDKTTKTTTSVAGAIAVRLQ